MATNKVNGKVYIGKTKRNLELRIKEHMRDCTRKKLEHLYFYRALRKYGLENFEWHILDYTNDNLDILEMYYIDYFKSYYFGYNSTLGGDGVKVVELKPRTKKHCENISKAKRGKPNKTKGIKRKPEPIEQRIKKSKSIKCNETGEIFYSIREACRKLGIAQSNLSGLLNGAKYKKSLKGYTFSFV